MKECAKCKADISKEHHYAKLDMKETKKVSFGIVHAKSSFYLCAVCLGIIFNDSLEGKNK